MKSFVCQDAIEDGSLEEFRRHRFPIDQRKTNVWELGDVNLSDMELTILHGDKSDEMRPRFCHCGHLQVSRNKLIELRGDLRSGCECGIWRRPWYMVRHFFINGNKWVVTMNLPIHSSSLLYVLSTGTEL